MADRDTLYRTLPDNVHSAADALLQANADKDLRDVVADLHRQGKLNAGELKDAIVALESENRITHVAPKPPDNLGRPDVLGQLGAGAMGEVLIAKDPGLNRVVAIKRIHPDAAQNRTMMRRFYTEAQVNAQLDHPNIIPIHGLIPSDDGSIAYAMKLVRGQTLEDYLHACVGSSEPQHGLAARLERFLHVCDAMAYAHERGILHRDLKPENIMVGSHGEVLVMDWGIAKVLAHRDDPAGEPLPEVLQRKGTRVGTLMGTPRYMSPEQAEGRNDLVSPASDQYALGLILYEVVGLTPAAPDDLTLEAMLEWARSGQKRPLKGVDRALAAVIDKATHPSPEQRYADVDAFAEDIRRWLRDEAPFAAPDGLFGRVQRWIGRHRQVAATAIVGLFSTVVAGGALVLTLAIAAVAFQQYRADQREAMLIRVLHATMDRAAEFDAKLHDIEAVVHGMAYAADTALEASPPRTPHNTQRDKPPGLVDAPRYGGPITVDWASVAASPGSRTSNADLARLAGLGDVLTQALVASGGSDGRRLSRSQLLNKLGDKGMPGVWAHIGTRRGLFAESPGQDAFHATHPSVSKVAWFQAPKRSRGAAWSGPTLDPKGTGQLLTVSVPWFDESGQVEGVAAMDLSVAWFADKLAPPSGAKGAWVLDRKGRAVAWTGMDSKAQPDLSPLPFPEHASRIRPDRAGWSESRDGTLAVWSPIRSLGYTYVIVSDPKYLTRGTP